MLWVKAFHIIAMVAWFAGLFYLPRLFVYHASATDETSLLRFNTMEYRLYYAIMWPAAWLTTVLGLTLIGYNVHYYMASGWMHAKFLLVVFLWGYHFFCGHFLRCFRAEKNVRSSRFFRIFNEIPTVLLIAIVLLVTIKPF